jgi:hypothetical protein
LASGGGGRQTKQRGIYTHMLRVTIAKNHICIDHIFLGLLPKKSTNEWKSLYKKGDIS